MDKDKIKLNCAQILIDLFEEFKNNSWVLTYEKIERKKLWGIMNKWGEDDFRKSCHNYGLSSGITIDSSNEMWFLYDSDTAYAIDISSISIDEFDRMFKLKRTNSIILKNKIELRVSKEEFDFLIEFKNRIHKKASNEFNLNLKSKKRQEVDNQNEANLLNERKKIFFDEFDSNGDGIIDLLEGEDDFLMLLKKHQKIILEIDKNYVHKFVKISNYLRDKRNNIQDIFLSLKQSDSNSNFNDNIGILKNQIHTYELLLFHSLSMITSLVEGDLIIFYEIYESFDKLNMFNSNWENEVKQRLVNVGDKLDKLMYSINSMESSILAGLNSLTYHTQLGFTELSGSITRELRSIDSSIQFNNLIAGISAYQLYKINKQTKGLVK